MHGGSEIMEQLAKGVKIQEHLNKSRFDDQYTLSLKNFFGGNTYLINRKEMSVSVVQINMGK